MSQFKKHILILFLMPLIVKSAFGQAIEENSSDIPAPQTEIIFNVNMQQSDKKVVPWYKKGIYWKDLIIVGLFLTGLYKYNGEYNSKKTLRKIFKFFLFICDSHYDFVIDQFNSEFCYCTICSNKRSKEYRKQITEKKRIISSFASADFKKIYFQTRLFNWRHIKLLSEEDRIAFYGIIDMLRMRFDTNVIRCNGDAVRIKQLQDQLKFDLQRFFNTKIEPMIKRKTSWFYWFYYLLKS